MNGRVYDPVLGRMLSPDNFVQNATSTQNYNRYTYCNNNPLKYTDPSGNVYLINPETNLYEWVNFRGGSGFYSGGGGGTSGNSSAGSYYYNWDTKSYYNSSGQEVPFSEVMNNYVVPNASPFDPLTVEQILTNLLTMKPGQTIKPESISAFQPELAKYNKYIKELVRTDAGFKIIRSSFVGTLVFPEDAYPHITIEYDIHGNRTSLADPDAGTITSVYNAYGQLTSQTDAKNKTTLYTYDLLGRILTKTDDDGTTTYQYDTKTHGIGLLSDVSSTNGITYDYTYDNLSRLATTTETIDNNTYQSVNNYDSYGRLSKLTYPGSFAVTYNYQNGQLKDVRNFASSDIIWQGITQDNFGNYNNQYKAGNNQNTYIARDVLGRITGINTMIGTNYNVQWLNYDYTDMGNMYHRTDNISGQMETFDYDNLNRLKNIYLDNSNISNYHIQSLNFDMRGNITTKTDAGTLNYENTVKPDWLTTITNPVTIPASHNLQYYINGKTKNIKQDLDSLEFTYGPDLNRKKTELYNDKVLQKTKYFALGNYEEEVDATTSEVTKYYYIAGGDGLAAIYKKTGTAAGVMYYVYKDMLGSIDLLTDASGNVAERYAYDAWGNRRNPNDWQQPDTRTNLIISRGYTGQEHLDVFGLINLNGRIYEPLTARFLSPDNYVSSFTNTQGFNRYAYGYNNPLGYTDIDGNNPLLIYGIACFAMNVMYYGMESYNQGQGFWNGALRGGFTGLASYGIGQGLSYAGAQFTGALPGAAYGMMSGAIGGGLSGGLASFASGGDFWEGAKQGAISGGIIGGIGGGLQGYFDAYNAGNNIWWGTKQENWGYNRNQWSLAWWDKPDVVTSPIQAVEPKINSGCAVIGMESVSKSYGLTEQDQFFWKTKYENYTGLPFTGIDASNFKNYVESVNGYSVDLINKDYIFSSLQAGKRVGIGIYDENNAQHFMLVKQMKIWPSGKQMIKYWDPKGFFGREYNIPTEWRWWSIYR